MARFISMSRTAIFRPAGCKCWPFKVTGLRWKSLKVDKSHLGSPGLAVTLADKENIFRKKQNLNKL